MLTLEVVCDFAKSQHVAVAVGVDSSKGDAAPPTWLRVTICLGSGSVDLQKLFGRAVAMLSPCVNGGLERLPRPGISISGCDVSHYNSGALSSEAINGLWRNSIGAVAKHSALGGGDPSGGVTALLARTPGAQGGVADTGTAAQYGGEQKDAAPSEDAKKFAQEPGKFPQALDRKRIDRAANNMIAYMKSHPGASPDFTSESDQAVRKAHNYIRSSLGYNSLRDEELEPVRIAVAKLLGGQK